MRTKCKIMLLLVAVAPLFILQVCAADSPPATWLNSPLLPLIDALFGKLGLSLAAFIGAARLFVKPLHDAVQLFIKQTPSTRDDIVLERFEASGAWKVFCWALDYTTSIKIGTQRPIPVVEESAPPKSKAPPGGLGGTLSVMLLCGLLLVEAGCTRTLNPAGYYGRIDAAQPAVTSGPTTGQILVNADQAIGTARRTITAFLQWEMTNRSHVGAEVTRVADGLRGTAPKYLQSAVRLRDAYAANPTTATRNALDDSIRLLDAALLEVSRYYKR